MLLQSIQNRNKEGYVTNSCTEDDETKMMPCGLKILPLISHQLRKGRHWKFAIDWALAMLFGTEGHPNFV